jgi:PAS domain S-box-containing protein
MAETIHRALNLPFMPHGMCYLWQPWLVWLHVVSDLLITLAYSVIPLALIHFIRRRRDVPFGWMFWCFGVFIVACGATHALEAWNVWHANYVLSGSIKAVTALASAPTALLLVRLIPRALAIPNPEQLRRSEERFHMASKTGKMFAYEWNVTNDVIVRSGDSAAILGIDEQTSITGQQVIGKIHPDDRESVVAAVAALSPEQPNLQIAYRMFRPDGTLIWVERDSRAYFDADGKMLRVVGMVIEITERKRIEQELHKLSYQLLRSQDIERRNMARSLHESVGQTLAALKMAIAEVEYSRDNDEADGKNLKIARGLVEDALREVRVISYLMHPPLLEDAGLGLALHWYVRGFSERSGVKVKLEIADDLGRHSQEIETTIFRIAQEALTNVYRHSGSPTATIRLMRDDQQIRLEIQDCGRGLPLGMEIAEPVGILGVGIAGMRERVKELRGKFQVESIPGHGMILRITLPVEKPTGSRQSINSSIELKNSGVL